MSTISKMISDVHLRIYGGELSDDDNINRKQIKYWIGLAYQEILPEWINKVGKGDVPSAALKSYSCVCVNKQKEICVAGSLYTRTYIELPVTVLSLPMDKGVYSVIPMVSQGQPLQRITTPGEYQMLRHTRYGSKQKSFYREANRVYLINGFYPKHCKFELLIVPGSIDDLAESDSIPAPSDIVASILEEAESIGRRMKYNSNSDLLTDGREEKA